MKDFNNLNFVRWGNINPRKHKEGRLNGTDENRGFHTAPCYRGIYAFPEGFIEPFLLGGVEPVNGKINNRCFFLRDENGNKIVSDNFWHYVSSVFDEINRHYTEGYMEVNSEYKKLVKQKNLSIKDLSEVYDEKEGKNYIVYRTNKHKFKYTGLIWHHLTNVCDKTNIIKIKGSWILTSFKTYIKCLKRTVCNDKFKSYMMKPKSERSGNPHACTSVYSKDHFEVFIEKLK